jgi:23S rRNA (pseudouridine1915-N3)-methyltransferase
VKLRVIAVGRPGPLLQPAIAEYEARARRYWSLEVVDVKEERAGKGSTDAAVRAAEGDRIMKRVPRGSGLVALTREGASWSSSHLARRLDERAVHGGGDVAFVIGGALGLGEQVLQAAWQTLSLSALTLPHDLARLVLLEQLYRAGTILRGEPYHKGGDDA